MTDRTRAVAGAFGALAALFLVLQFIASMDDGARGPLVTLWVLGRFFTILTNAIVAATFLRAAWLGRWPAAAWMAGNTLWIVVVGIVYHVLLSATHDPLGLGWWSNLGTHTVVPVGCVLIWATIAPKSGLRPVHALYWALWPLVYSGYALGRGLLDGVFPYFFLDPVTMGWGGVAAYVAGLAALFIGLGLILVALGRRMAG